MFQEFEFRKIIPLSSEDYANEDAEFVEWVLRFESMEARVQKELTERMMKT